MPIAPRHLGEELVGAWIASSGTSAAATVCQGFSEVEESLKAGRFDVVLGACPASTKLLTERGLVIPESDVALYHYRLAMFLPPGNPLGLMSAQDLANPALQIGICTNHASGPLVEELKTRAAAEAALDPLLDRLEAGQLDVVVGMDSLCRLRPELVTIRLPRSAAGEEAARTGHGFAARGTKRLADAVALLQFCVDSEQARDLKLARAVMTSDGSRAKDYKEGAGTRMMPSYISVAKTVAADYAPGATNCLDLGCGPGQLTLEVAKASGLEVTGLDIEPEAIDVAAQYAKACGLASRMHWVAADVHALPYADNSFDVVMSRGSIFFWRDQATALREIMRVLKPGGWAFLGGGSGRFLSPEEAERTHQPTPRSFNFPFPLDNVPALMARAGIPHYRHITEGGTWIEFQKAPAQSAPAGKQES
jgi:SAM-dependent methyltransferase